MMVCGTRVRLCGGEGFVKFLVYYGKLTSPHNAGYRRRRYANPFLAVGKKLGSGRSSAIKRKKTPQGCLSSFGKRLRKRYFCRTLIRIRTQVKSMSDTDSAKIFFLERYIHFFKWKIKLIVFPFACFVQSFSYFNPCDHQGKYSSKAKDRILAARRNTHAPFSSFRFCITLITFDRLYQTKSDI